MGVHAVPQEEVGTGGLGSILLALLTYLQPNIVCLATFDEMGDEESTAKFQASTHAQAEAFRVQTVQANLLQLSVTVMGGVGDGPALA